MTETTEGKFLADSQPFRRRSYRSDPGVPPFPDDRPILIYDGQCRLCSGVVRFVLRRDKHDTFRFLAAQSALAAALFRHYGLDPVNFQTYVLLENGQPCFKSEATLRLCSRLGLPWSLLSIGRILPSAIRDRLYDLIARNRLRWFGTRSTCFLLEPGEAHRFLA